MPILGIEEITPLLYRVMHAGAKVHPNRELVRDYIVRTGVLPHLPPPVGLILRKKPRIHWCSYEPYETPADTSAALQILPSWNSDCKLRATIPQKDWKDLSFSPSTATPSMKIKDPARLPATISR